MRGEQGRAEEPPGTTPRVVWCQRRGGTAGDPVCGVSSGAAHPADWAASPLSPDSALSRARPASLLSGPRASSRQLRHLPANALLQPGPTTAPTGGRRRAAARGVCYAPRRLRTGQPCHPSARQPDCPLQRSAESRPQRRQALRPSRRGEPLPPCGVAQSEERRAPQLSEKGRGKGTGSST